jgi:hypothetical protein
MPERKLRTCSRAKKLAAGGLILCERIGPAEHGRLRRAKPPRLTPRNHPAIQQPDGRVAIKPYLYGDHVPADDD